MMATASGVVLAPDWCGDLGDLDACAAALETLSEECYDGYTLSCDVLYRVSPDRV
jgi:hypothetical protein